MKNLICFGIALLFLPLLIWGQSTRDVNDARRIFDAAVALKNQGVNFDLAIRKLRAAILLDPDLEREADSVIVRITELEHVQQARAALDKQLSEVRQLETLAGTVGEKYPDRKILILLEALYRNKGELSNENALQQEILRGLRTYYNSIRLRHSRLHTFTMSKDNGWLATGGEDSIVQLWNLGGAAKDPYYVLPQSGKVRWMEFSPDAQWLAVVTDPVPAYMGIPLRPIAKEARLTFYKLENPSLPDTQFVLRGGFAKQLSFSPDGYCAVLQFSGALRVYHPVEAHWRETAIPKGSLVGIQCFAFGAGGILAVGDEMGQLGYWYTDSLGSMKAQVFSDFPRSTVKSLEFSPDGRWLAATYEQGTSLYHKWAFLWLLEGSNTKRFELEYPASRAIVPPTILFSDDSRWLTIADHSSEIPLWQLTDAPDTAFIVSYGRSFINETVNAVRFSHDSRMLAIGTVGFGVPSGVVRIWDLDNPNDVIPPLSGHQGKVTDLAFSPDDKRLYSASQDWTVRVWNTKVPMTAPVVLKGQEGTVDKLCAGENFLVAGSLFQNLPNNESSESIRWYTLLPDHLPRPMENMGYISARSGGSQLSADDRWLGLEGNQRAYLFSLESRQDSPLLTLKGWLPKIEEGIIFSPQSRWMLTVDSDSLRLANLKQGTSWSYPFPSGGHGPLSLDYCFNAPENEMALLLHRRQALLYQTTDNGTLRVTDSISLSGIGPSGPNIHPGIHFNESGNRLLITDSVALVYTIDPEGKAGPAMHLDVGGENITAGTISEDQLYMVGFRGSFFVGKLNGREPPILQRFAIPLRLSNVHLTFSPDRRWLVVSGSGNVFIWKTDGSQPSLFSIANHGNIPYQSFVRQVKFSNDSKWLSVYINSYFLGQNGGEPAFHLLDVSGAWPREYLSLADSTRFGEGTFSLDGKWFAVRKVLASNIERKGTSVALFSLTDRIAGRKPYLFNVQDHNIEQLAFSRDSKYLYTCSSDRSIVRWNLRSRQPVFIQDPDQLFFGLTTEAYPLANNTLITVNTYDNKDTSERQSTLVNYYDFDINYIIKLARIAVGRNLSLEEWKKYFSDTPRRKAFDDLP